MHRNGLLSDIPPPPAGRTGWPWTEESDPVKDTQRTHFPRITIVTPTFNQGKFIEATIRSVLLQNYANLEYIIVDGGSNDETLSIIKKYSKWLSSWKSEKDNGQSDAINKGLRMKTGQVFNWLNSDDYYEKGTLSKVGQAFLDKNLTAFAGRARKFGNQDSYVPQFNQDQSVEEEILLVRMIQPSTFFHQSAIQKMGELSESLHYSMDYEWFVKYFLAFGKNSIQYSDNVLSHCMLHDNAKTSRGTENFYREMATVAYNVSISCGTDPAEIEWLRQFHLVEEALRKYQIEIPFNRTLFNAKLKDKYYPYSTDQSRLYRDVASYLNSFGDRKGTIAYSFKAFRTRPLQMINLKYLVRALLNR